jgi:hypothetical protein
MSALKYTDRDVRENPDYTQITERYLEQYEGEFQFLIDCKMRLATGVGLTVGMIRGVLNCMRVDPRADLRPPVGSDDDNVIQFTPKSRPIWTECDIEDAHMPHPRDEEQLIYACSGVYPINRRSYRLPAKVKLPFVAGNSGLLIHKVGNALVEWHPKAHDVGFRHEPTFYVKAECRTQLMRDPLLLDDAKPWSTERGGKVVMMRLCHKCFPVQERLV